MNSSHCTVKGQKRNDIIVLICYKAVRVDTEWVWRACQKDSLKKAKTFYKAVYQWPLVKDFFNKILISMKWDDFFFFFLDEWRGVTCRNLACGVRHDVLTDTRLSVFLGFGIYLYFQKQMWDFGYLQFFCLFRFMMYYVCQYLCHWGLTRKLIWHMSYDSSKKNMYVNVFSPQLWILLFA